MQSSYYNPEENECLAERVFATAIDGLYYLVPARFEDERGFYAELALIPDLETVLKEEFRVKQVSQARSKTKVVRGMHAEQWSKLVHVCGGKVFCALADVRPDSETFLAVEYFLFGEGGECLDGSLFISRGIANSVCVLEGPSDYVYFVDQLYRGRDKKHDRSISVFDEDLKIEWPIEESQMILSNRDRNSVRLRELYPEKFE